MAYVFMLKTCWLYKQPQRFGHLSIDRVVWVCTGMKRLIFAGQSIAIGLVDWLGVLAIGCLPFGGVNMAE